MYQCTAISHICALCIYSISVDISTYSVESNIIHPTYYILCRSKNDHALNLFTTYKISYIISTDRGRRITWNVCKLKICQIAPRDHHAVHTILQSPDTDYSAWPVSAADQLTNKYVSNYRGMSRGGYH
jgi:hypothetical protein